MGGFAGKYRFRAARRDAESGQVAERVCTMPAMPRPASREDQGVAQRQV